MKIKTNDNFEKFVDYLKSSDQFEKNSKDPTLLADYRDFMQNFPISKLENLTLDEYCVGKGEKSFCWWFERGLVNAIGRYSPGNAAGHLIYFAKNGELKKVEKLLKYEDDVALKNVLRIHAVIAKADPKDLHWIDDDQQISSRTGIEDLTIGVARKLRVLSIYHPNDVIPIASSEHCAHFLQQLGCDVADIPPYHQSVARMLLLRDYFDEIKKKVPELTSTSFVAQLYDRNSPLAKPVKLVANKINNQENRDSDKKNDLALNVILYGPPGTGKTFKTIDYALKIIDASMDNKPRTEKKRKFDSLIDQGQVVFTTFHQSMSYEDFIEGIKPKTSPQGKVIYEVESGIFKALCEEAKEQPSENFVLIIDEINRGNVSQIFGELITLIEDGKRLGQKEEITLTLPYSKGDAIQFGVPENVYIIGTMNTADRSVEALDAALRRRFSFIEMPPNPDLIRSEGELKDQNGILAIDESSRIDLAKMLDTINQRIEKLLDSDHQIGHSFLLSVDSISSLKHAFQNKIIPLLKEYFYGDFGKLGLVLGEGFFESTGTSNNSIFAKFGDYDRSDFNERVIYKLKTISSNDGISGMSDKDFIEAIQQLLTT